MSSPPLKPMPGVWTGEYYSSGAYHGAWDLPTPIGTPVHAVRDGTIHSCADGVPNDENQPGDTDYSGEPSNWILQWCMFNGKPYSVYYQHLSPGLKVRSGKKVKAGEIIARSGDSGNSSGPHLHIHAMTGHQYNRYQLYINKAVAVYPPSILWSDKKEPLMANREEMEDFARVLLSTPIYGKDALPRQQDITVRQALREAHEVHHWLEKQYDK